MDLKIDTNTSTKHEEYSEANPLSGGASSEANLTLKSLSSTEVKERVGDFSEQALQ